MGPTRRQMTDQDAEAQANLFATTQSGVLYLDPMPGGFRNDYRRHDFHANRRESANLGAYNTCGLLAFRKDVNVQAPQSGV